MKGDEESNGDVKWREFNREKEEDGVDLGNAKPYPR
jgi:hypothetical protein